MPLTSNQHPVDTLARFFLYALLIIAPWLHGAEQAWEQLFTAAGIFIVLLFILTSRHIPLVSLNQAMPVICLFALWLAYCTLYLIPLPAGVIQFISPATFDWHTQVDKASAGYLSVYRQASLIELLKYGALVALFIIVITLFNSIKKLRQLALVLVTGAATTAIYSQVNYITGGEFELVSAIPPWDFSWHEGIRGTFSYKNQYAMYLVMAICVVAGLIADTVICQRRATGRWLSARTAWLVVAFILLIVTLLNTSSRGALLAIILSSFVTMSLLIARNRFLATRLLSKKILISAALALAVLGAGFTQSSIYDRFTSQKMEDNGRAMLRQTAIDVFSDYPVMGTGPGTYPYVQHQYKPLLLGNSQMSKRAHNDYLETLATQGVIGFILLAMPLALMCFTLMRTSLCASDAGLLIGTQTAILAYLFQATFDVNAGVFILPVTFILLLSIGWRLSSQSLSEQAFTTRA
ncbi:O-antigen ligase family protein [Salinimonas sp. HHU 13199]|uniref:O-antigen ligase family protein n=1 Tax=Salinimonas profundi TaxID=2729140 RepID=A0ABR8LH05_9ALTE|nr:O-antigen ligase family protein [Salinimonas profundi]MBD3585535.1 O-antigen ligase family protein [Salinimonas profundi]